jgi:phospholipid N-methyltransferase
MITKLMLISALEIKAEIQSYLEQVKDESFLKVVHSRLDTYVKEQEDPIIGYEIDGTPVRASVAREELLADVEAAKKGEYITLEDFRKEVDTW